MKPKCSELRTPRADQETGNPPLTGWLRWLANYGLSLSAADCVLESPQERVSACPFAPLLKPDRRRL